MSSVQERLDRMINGTGAASSGAGSSVMERLDRMINHTLPQAGIKHNGDNTSRPASSVSTSKLPSIATSLAGNKKVYEPLEQSGLTRGTLDMMISPDNWTSAEDAEIGMQSWDSQLSRYKNSLDQLQSSISNAEKQLQQMSGGQQTENTASVYNQLYDRYTKMIDDYNTTVSDYNRVIDKYDAGLTKYKEILGNGMNKAEAAASEIRALVAENSRLQQQVDLIKAYDTSGLNMTETYAVPIEAEIQSNTRKIKELQAEETRSKMQYYSSLALMDDYADLSKPGNVTDDTRYDYINDIDNAHYKNEHTTDTGGEPIALRLYQHLTDDERKIYNYLYASQGKEAADRFLDDIDDTLRTRQGAAQYEQLGTLGKALYWIPAGLEQFGSGIKQLFQREAVPVSPTQITSQLIQQEAQEKSPVLGSLYTLGVTLSNMAPSILTSALGGWALGAAGLPASAAGLAGSTALGASAGGNAYTQKLREGYSSEAAQNYATLVGASEGALQYLLGGIGALSKSGTGRVAAKIAGLDNALGRVARTVSGSTTARLLGSMISEGTEEGLQELLEPAFAAIIFDEEYEADFEDAAYAFLLGALSAGIIEGPAAIAYARRPAGFTFRDMDGYADNGVDYFEGANTLEEVEARYRDLARQYHPDVGGDAATMAEINRQRTMARAFFRGRAEAASADEAADTTPEAAANTERADSVIRRLTAGRATEETTPETAGASIEGQIYSEAGGIVLPTADTAGDFSPRVEVGETVAPTLEAPRAAVPETNAVGNIVLPTADDTMIGGMTNGQHEKQEWQQRGLQVPSGNGGRLGDIGAGRQTGRLGQSAGGRAATFEQSRTAIERQNRARDLRLQEVSSAELGIPEGTQTRNVRVLPESDWDGELVSTAERVRNVTGREVHYVLGSIEVRTAGNDTHRVRGVWMPNGDIIVQADNMRVSAQQIAEHEIYHDIAAQTPGTDYEVEQRIREQFGDEEFERVVEIYIQKLHGIVDLPANASESEFETALARVKQEIFADAYAGINAFGAHAERFADVTRETVKERTGIRSRENDDAVRDRTGPPAERYSIDEEYATELELWNRDGRPDGEVFVLGSTGEALQGLGAMEQDIYLRSEKINAILDAHPEMTLSEIKRIPEILDDPVLIAKSAGEGRGGRNSRLTIMGSLRAQNGKPIMVVLDLRPIEGRLLVNDMQKINSAYTRSNAANYLRRSEILYADEKRTIPLLRSAGLTIASQRLLRHGSMGSITYSGNDVNIEGVPFSDLVETVEPEQYSYVGINATNADLKALKAFETEKRQNNTRYSVEEYGEEEKREHVEKALDYFGSTYKWIETGYLTPDGKRIDFSGKRLGAPGGYRTVDHREIRDAIDPDYGGDDYGGSLVQFMSEGNIRIIPETSGINLSVKPTKAQEQMLSDYISRERGEVLVDIDSLAGVTISSTEYPRGTHANKILADIRNYFDKGEAPTASELLRYRYSIEDDDQPVEQAISSAKTSLRQVPALFKDKNVQFGDVNIDIGGGKYDLATEFLAERGTQNLVFDPYNRGETTNRATLDFLRDGSRADTATNANVLNVIAEAPARANVILEMAKAIKPDGKAYFMVYEGDGSGVGRETSAGWQNNRKTADYMDEIKRYFDSVERRGKLIIASNPKADLPKALWEVQPGDAVRYSAADDEPRPVIAKQDLRRRLLDTFSVPPGSRAELGRIIEGFADKMIRSGRYTEQDRSALFDKLYDAGAMTLTADPYYSDARGALVKRRMYVSDALKAEFGDDWNDFRKRAFAAGIYLTNNSNDMAPDMWQAELGETLPGLFDADNLDMRSFMERVVQVAEEGRDEQVNLAEYTQMLAGENYVSEDEVLQDLEQRVDWELRTFAEKADLEVRLRGRGTDGITNTERKRIIQEERANYWQLHKQYQEETRRRIAEERGKRHASEREAREKINNIIREEREKYWQKRRDYQQRADERVRQERERRWAVQAETRQRIDDVEQAERRTYYERLERYKEGRRATDARERERRKAMSERRRETAELRNLQQRTLKQIQWLAKNQYRAPAELKQQWDEVLGDLDIFAVSAANEMNYSKKYDATWRDIADMVRDFESNPQKYPNFIPSEELKRIAARVNNEKIGDLDIGALQDLYKAAVGLRTEFYNRNRVIGDEEGRLFAELYADSKEEINSAPGGYSGNVADKVFNTWQLTPMNYLERMAGWNPDSAWYSMAKQLEKGEENMRAYEVEANKMLADFLEEHEDWVLRSDGQGKDAIWYEVEVPELEKLGMGDKPIFGKTYKVYMTPAQKVQLYLESKNYDNLRHMAGGRTFADKKLYSEGKRKEAYGQDMIVRLAPETVRHLVEDLTPEERELASILERYYNQFAAERINRVSNALYGYDRAVTKNYAPIYTDSNFNQREIGKYDQTAEGVGNMKQRVSGAKNPSYNLSAYDAFERHVDQTARFVGMAIPARNWNTLLRWTEQNDSMRNVITHKWGVEAAEYIEGILKALQGERSAETHEARRGFDRVLSNYISAIFGANPSIVIKQLGSVPLGSAYLGLRNLPSLRQIWNIDYDFISKYTSELDWRLLGYSTPETKQLKEHPNWTERNYTTRFLFGGGAITWMDGAASSVLWPWAENKVRRERPELEVGAQEQVDAGQSPFYKAVAAEFNNAVSRSQSMPDEIHQSSIRKSNDPRVRAFTMFRSDAAQLYNALRQKIGEARYYKRVKASPEQQRAARRSVGEAFLAAIMGAAWVEAVNLLINLWKYKGKNYRDDEDELTSESVISEMVHNMISSMAGTVLGGEELADIAGNILTDDKWWGIDIPGGEQLNDVIEYIIDSGKSIRDIVSEANNISGQGGDVGAYFEENAQEIIGGVKSIAETVAMYLAGMPVQNVEKYLLGLLQWLAPGIATAYEDMLETPERADLEGLEGEALVTRVSDILAGRLEDVSEPAAQTVATLYAAGYTEALPSGIPKQVTVTDKKTDTSETVELDAYQQQFFGQVWTETVGRAVNELVLMPEFETASPEDQAKMLSQIYRFANETAKAETVEKYSPPSTMAEAAEDIASGRTLAEWAAYDVFSDDVSGTFGKLTDEGLDYEQALDVAETLDDLGDDATSVERYLAVARMPLSEDEKELALRGVMTDSAYAKYETARSAGIDTLDYCEFLDRISDISGDGRQERVWALIDSMRLTNRQKDVLHLAAGYKDSTLSKTPWHN